MTTPAFDFWARAKLPTQRDQIHSAGRSARPSWPFICCLVLWTKVLTKCSRRRLTFIFEQSLAPLRAVTTRRRPSPMTSTALVPTGNGHAMSLLTPCAPAPPREERQWRPQPRASAIFPHRRATRPAAATLTAPAQSSRRRTAIVSSLLHP